MEKSEMKHAYLIMAHHEFEVLGKLVQAIDDNGTIYLFISTQNSKAILC